MAAFVVLHYQLVPSACTTIKTHPRAVQISICHKSWKQRQKKILTQLFCIKNNIKGDCFSPFLKDQNPRSKKETDYIKRKLLVVKLQFCFEL